MPRVRYQSALWSCHPTWCPLAWNPVERPGEVKHEYKSGRANGEHWSGLTRGVARFDRPREWCLRPYGQVARLVWKLLSYNDERGTGNCTPYKYGGKYGLHRSACEFTIGSRYAFWRCHLTWELRCDLGRDTVLRPGEVGHECWHGGFKRKRLIVGSGGNPQSSRWNCPHDV